MHSAAFPELAAKTGLGTLQAAEQQLLPGLLTLAALPFGLLAGLRTGQPDGRRAAVAVAAWSVAVLILFVTQFGPVWPYELVNWLPGANSIRAVSRIVLVLLLPMGLVLGACCEALAEVAGRAGRVCALLVGLGAVIAVAADHQLQPTDGPKGHTWGPQRYSKEVAVRRQAVILGAIRSNPSPTLLYVFPSFGLGGPGGTLGVQCEAIRAAQDAGIPCVNGWSGYLMGGWDFFSGYRSLETWFTLSHVPAEALGGLVVVGAPLPDADPLYEAAWRTAFPPRALVAP
jgi:hypothetical protein